MSEDMIDLESTVQQESLPNEDLHEPTETSHADNNLQSPMVALDEDLANPDSGDESEATNNKGKKGKKKIPHRLFEYNNFLYSEKQDDYKTTLPVGEVSKVSAVLRNIENDTYSEELTYFRYGLEHRKNIPKGMINKRNLLELRNSGVDVNDLNIDFVLEYLIDTEKSADLQLTYENLGWLKFKENLVFRLNKAIGIKATYNGILALEPKGSFQGWKEVIETHVLGHIPLEFALVFGLTAPIVGLVGKVLGIDSIVNHFKGNSSMGKTTATRVAVSAYGLPHNLNNGLIKTFNNTANALIGEIRGNFGVPVVLDESGTSNHEDFSRLLYLLPAGQDKGRLTQTGEKRPKEEWATSILSTGEHSLLDKSNQSIGLKVRITEYSNIAWTKSADHADTIKVGLLENYGFAGIQYVKYLRKYGEEALIEDWKICKKECLAKMTVKDTFSNRIADKIAMIMVATDVAAHALGLNFYREGIISFMLDTELQSMDGRDIGENALEYLKHYIITNRGSFYVINKRSEIKNSTAKETIGRIDYFNDDSNTILVCFTPDNFKKVMNEGNFQDVAVILESFKQRGILDHDKHKYTRKRKMHSTLPTVRVHAINIPMPSDKVEPFGFEDCFTQHLRAKDFPNFGEDDEYVEESTPPFKFMDTPESLLNTRQITALTKHRENLVKQMNTDELE